MRKAIFIALFVHLFFLCEFFIFNLIGTHFVPNLLLLLTVFATLAFGIRYGLLAAIWAGVIKDSFSSYIFGINIFTFVFCAFATVFLSQRIYERRSNFSRLLIVFAVLLIEMLITNIIHGMYGSFQFAESFIYIFIPEVVITLLICLYVFNLLKRCVLKLFVM